MNRLSNFQYWIRFVILASVFLVGWFVFWEIKNQGWLRLADFSSILPVSQEHRSDIEALSLIADKLTHTNGEVRTFLILFQNNLELRPGGGFIGSFGILKVKDGTIVEFTTHDTGNFDGRIPSTITPPYPMSTLLHIDSWKLRDSNFSPDFPTNARQAITFYAMGDGQEHFDGVIGITTEVLESVLNITGPVTLDGFPGTYAADKAVIDLEYQVEQGYRDQNIAAGERKSVLKILGDVILTKVKALPVDKQYELFTTMLRDLHSKAIQVYFVDEYLQGVVADAGWDGAVDSTWHDDSFMLIDANLGALKSDYHMRRRIEYTVDLSKEVPQATLKMIYTHTGVARNWYTKDYISYLRAYLPEGSFITSVTNGDAPVYGNDLGKKYVGVTVGVPLASERTVTFEYTLPKTIDTSEWYNLKVTKQSGVTGTPLSVTIIDKQGKIKTFNETLNRDFVLSERENE
ncbi:MAG: DUF4012 domain-containing protein [Candidatus Moranbacteria bacterium]|jgi:hypothetical protein|nr:DUF4012 domain-containing protein [Candidatus Moranbacteria bacterium]MBP9801816.1 DUF4012 domain-containing protein [Candidatus Moranbacteria bacterium]